MTGLTTKHVVVGEPIKLSPDFHVSGQARAVKFVEKADPDLMWLTPPTEKVEGKASISNVATNFCLKLARQRMSLGKRIVWEIPWKSRVWQLKEMRKVLV